MEERHTEDIPVNNLDVFLIGYDSNEPLRYTIEEAIALSNKFKEKRRRKLEQEILRKLNKILRCLGEDPDIEC